MKIQVFNNPQFGDVRTAIDANNEPLFCLVDVCKVLDLTPSKVAQRLDDGVLSKYPTVDSLGREQLANFVNEDGLYDAILDSRKPEARSFRKWITSEVLPSIRKTGGYMIARVDETPEEIMARAFIIAQDTINRQKMRIEEAERRIADQSDTIYNQGEVIKQKDEEIAKLEVKSSYLDQILGSPDLLNVSQIAKDYGYSAKTFNKILQDLGIQYNSNDQWLLYQVYADRGYVESTVYTTVTGHQRKTTKWTHKGQMFLYERLKKEGIIPMSERVAKPTPTKPTYAKLF